MGERYGVRVRYGVAVRSGSQQDEGPGLVYQGLTPNDVALQLWYFGPGHFGGALTVQREGFGLFGDGGLITAGSLLRASASGAARVSFGPARLEGTVGYGFSQLPAFGSSASPAFAAFSRHALLVGARASMDLGPFSLEARGEYPLALAVSDGRGTSASAFGFAAGASLLLPLGRADSLAYGVVLDYQYVTDRVTGPERLESTQTLSRAGIAFELEWLTDAPARPVLGALDVAVLDATSGSPIPNASVTVAWGGQERALSADADGRLSVEGVPPGPVRATATAAGYVPLEAQGEVLAHQRASLELRVQKEPPKVGGLTVTVLDKLTQSPLAGATVVVQGSEYISNASGRVVLADLPSGPLEVSATLQGYKPGAEVASIAPGKTAELPIALVKEEQKAPATITGIVRSKRGGAPIAAELSIPQARINTRADQRGAFTFRVEGGTYTIVISAPGFLTQTKRVTVKEGDQTIFNVDLHPK